MADKEREIQVDPFVLTLREERLARKIPLTELSAALDTPHSTLSNYETGKGGSAAPRVDLVRDWANLLDYDLQMVKAEKPSRRRRLPAQQEADDIPEDLTAVYLSRYQAALAMGMLMAQAAASQEKSPALADDLRIIADIVARSIH